MRLYLIISGLFCLSFFQAQQTTQYSHYMYNYFAYNPALAGSQNCYQLKLGFRTQWVGYLGNPETGFASFHTRLKFKKTRSNRTYHGVGAYIENDVVGYLGTTTVNGAYAYHFPVGRSVTASAGIFAGFQQFKADGAKIVAISNDDPALYKANSAILVPYLTPGIFLNHDDWFAGLAVRQIVRNKWSKVIGVDSRNRFHWSLVGGKRIRLNEKFNLVGSAMLKYAGYSAPSLELNLMAEITPAIELGILWRNQDALAALAKFKFAKYFTLAYAFDFTTSKLRNASSNTHEVIIGISACKHNSGDTFICPAFE
ncbi:MAG: PorP/SprF family type IX secretion system membrane protein [Flavobacteriales bacterium]|nr:PorP/SprF family type IX secretion system membrane protein [Flavobacteriales bacterium]